MAIVSVLSLTTFFPFMSWIISCENGAVRHCDLCVAAVVNVDLTVVEDRDITLFDKFAHAEEAVCDALYCVPSP